MVGCLGGGDRRVKYWSGLVWLEPLDIDPRLKKEGSMSLSSTSEKNYL